LEVTVSGRLFGVLFCALFAFATPSSAAVFNSHSGWFWGNPTPQGNDLRAIEFAGTTGYASGDFGALLRTTDGGATWTGLRTGLTASLTRLDVIDGDSLVVGGTCAIRRSDDAGESFRRLPFTPSESRCRRRLADFSFVDANVGYLVLQDGSVLHTADGGRSFSPRAAVPGTGQGGAEATSLLFVSAQQGYATTSAGQLYRTADGGRLWIQVFSAGSALRDVFFSGADGAVVGDGGVFATSANGGATWLRAAENQAYGIGFDFTSVRCAATTCLTTVAQTSHLMRTRDGGRSFLIIGPSANAVDFASSARAVAVGANGVTLLSNDGGESFTSISRRLNVSGFGRLRATSPSLAHIPGTRGALARTTDGGQTWINVGVATSAAVLDSSFPTAERGYALDVEGGLFRTENGGASWGILDTGTSTRPRAVMAPDASVVLLVGPRGVLRSTDGGDSFAPVRDSDVSEAVLSDADRAGSALVVFGSQEIAVSSDGGASWRAVSRPRHERGVVHVDFVSARTGFALLTDGRVFSTRNGGRSWRESLAVGNDTGSQLAFADDKRGWLVVGDFPLDGAHVLRTNNGGASWRPQLLGEGTVGSIAAGGAVAGFAHLIGPTETEATGLLATIAGGEAGSAADLELSTTRKRLSRPGRVEIRGELEGARGGEQVVVAYRRRDRSGWNHAVLSAANDGTFELSRRVARTTVFVAQWRGDEEHAAAASRAVTVRVVRRRR
jgi:photosystem II stability/assembly factor-like uncharacterized protein